MRTCGGVQLTANGGFSWKHCFNDVIRGSEGSDTARFPSQACIRTFDSWAMSPTYSLLLSILFLATGTLVFVQIWFTSDEIPGPIAGRLTQFYRVWLCLDGTAPRRYAELSQKYGLVVRTGPNHVSLSTAECIPIVYDVRYRIKKVSNIRIRHFCSQMRHPPPTSTA
jgi:hypothetical protein